MLRRCRFRGRSPISASARLARLDFDLRPRPRFDGGGGEVFVEPGEDEVEAAEVRDLHGLAAGEIPDIDIPRVVVPGAVVAAVDELRAIGRKGR